MCIGKKEIYEKAMKVLILDIANKYLGYIENYKSNDASEVILEYLDKAVDMALNIDQIKLILSSLNSITKMNRDEKRKFEKALNKETKFTVLFKIKEEKIRNEFIENLFKSYNEYEENYFNSENNELEKISEEKIMFDFGSKHIKNNYLNTDRSSAF